MRLLGSLCLAILVGLATMGAATACASTNSFGQDMFGISAGGTIQSENAKTLGRDLDAIKTVGARWVRIDINWAQIQADGPSSYNWGPIDRVVQGASQRGIKVLGIIDYTPSWARPAGTTDKRAPDPTQYATFASAAVEHYAAMGVHTYEVWNEPNTFIFWRPKPDPVAYTTLLKAAYVAIKGADSQATVLTGGAATVPTNSNNYAPVDWLQAIYANGGGGFFDAVSDHPYCWRDNTCPSETDAGSAWYQMYGTSPSLRSVMIDNGDADKKIWATEFGAPTDGPQGISEGVQAQMISEAFSLWSSYDWGGPLFVYQGRDSGTDTSTSEDFFGLLRYDFSQKPAYAAYQAAAAPPAPTFTATDPASPANDNSPKILGSAAPGSTVNLYTSSDCSGQLAATGSASDFSGSGIGTSVADDSSTTFTATATATDGITSACSSDSITYVEDSTAPTGGQITSDLPTFGLTTPFTVAWGGASDSGSGVENYDIYVLTAPFNGSFGSTTLLNSTSGPASESFPAQAGNTYCFHVTVTDNAGNTSAASADRCTAMPVDDAALAASAGGWSRATGQSGYYGGTYSLSSTKEASLSLAGAQAKQIALVATRCPTCGTVKVLQGTTLLKKVSLAYRKGTQTEQLIPVASFSTVHTGTVKVSVVSSGKQVIIDGLGVSGD